MLHTVIVHLEIGPWLIWLYGVTYPIEFAYYEYSYTDLAVLSIRFIHSRVSYAAMVLRIMN